MRAWLSLGLAYVSMDFLSEEAVRPWFCVVARLRACLFFLHRREVVRRDRAGGARRPRGSLGR